MYLLMLEGRLHLAPLDNPKVRDQLLIKKISTKSRQEILDVGTGTGIWAM